MPSSARPTTERTRKAVFDILGARVEGASVLDAAAGSGAYGLEALSRGAAAATFVEADRGAADALAKNVEALGLAGSSSVRRERVETFVARAAATRFDLAFFDPPYEAANGEALAGSLLGLVATGGLLVWERARRRSAESAAATALPAPFDVRRYGDTELLFFAGAGSR